MRALGVSQTRRPWLVVFFPRVCVGLRRTHAMRAQHIRPHHGRAPGGGTHVRAHAVRGLAMWRGRVLGGRAGIQRAALCRGRGPSGRAIRRTTRFVRFTARPRERGSRRPGGRLGVWHRRLLPTPCRRASFARVPPHRRPGHVALAPSIGVAPRGRAALAARRRRRAARHRRPRPAAFVTKPPCRAPPSSGGFVSTALWCCG